MLVERVGTIAGAMAYMRYPAQALHLRDELSATLDSIENSHNRLRSDFGPLSPALETLHSIEPVNLDIALARFIERARILVSLPDGSPDSVESEIRYLQNSLPAMISGLDRVATQYQLESERAVERSIAIDTLIGGATLLALLASGFFIFRPMERRVLAQHARELESANKALEASQYELQLQYDNAPDMLLSLDLDTQQVIRCNSTMAAKLGYTKDELIGIPRNELYAPDCREQAAKTFREFLANGRVDDVELQVLCKDRSVIDVSLSAVQYRDRDGTRRHGDAIWRDITARKQAERAVARRDRQLTTLYLLGEQMLLSKDLSLLMHNVAYCLYESLDARSVLVCELGPGEKHFTVRAGIGVPRRSIAAEPCPVEIGSFSDRILRSEIPVCCNRGEAGFCIYGVDYLDVDDVTAGIGCRITGFLGTIGLVVVFTGDHGASLDEDADYIQSLANLLGVAADRIRLAQGFDQGVARNVTYG